MLIGSYGLWDSFIVESNVVPLVVSWPLATVAWLKFRTGSEEKQCRQLHRALAAALPFVLAYLAVWGRASIVEREPFLAGYLPAHLFTIASHGLFFFAVAVYQKGYGALMAGVIRSLPYFGLLVAPQSGGGIIHFPLSAQLEFILVADAWVVMLICCIYVSERLIADAWNGDAHGDKAGPDGEAGPPPDGPSETERVAELTGQAQAAPDGRTPDDFQYITRQTGWGLSALFVGALFFVCYVPVDRMVSKRRWALVDQYGRDGAQALVDRYAAGWYTLWFAAMVLVAAAVYYLLLRRCEVRREDSEGVSRGFAAALTLVTLVIVVNGAFAAEDPGQAAVIWIGQLLACLFIYYVTGTKIRAFLFLGSGMWGLLLLAVSYAKAEWLDFLRYWIGQSMGT